MSFNYKQYTANNPLLQEVDEEVTVSSSGVAEEGSNFPRVALEDAALEAKQAGIDREEAVTIVNQAYGAGMSADGLNEDLGSNEYDQIYGAIESLLSQGETKENILSAVKDTLGLEEGEINEDIDIWQLAGDHLENFRSELANAHAVASENGDRDWLNALNKIALRLDALEGAMAEANAKLGVLPTK